MRGVRKKSRSHRRSLNDSLEGDVKAFLIDEGQLHTYDDLTKVNPVTPSTGRPKKVIAGLLLMVLGWEVRKSHNV